MLRLFLRFFGLEWSVAERKTEKSRRRFEGLTANLRDDMPRDSYNRGCYADVFVIKKLYVAVQIRLYIFYCSIFSPKCQFFFERSKKAFYARIVIRASRCAHGALNAVFSQHTFVCSATVLTPTVTMEHQPFVSPSQSQGIGKRSFAQFAVDVFAHFIADHLFVFQIQDGSKINPPPIGGNVRYISCPYCVECIGRKTTLYLVFTIHTIAFCLSVPI